ncbi:Acetyltransferase (GNAT) domain-containing protein [Alkalibacterium subtropicum]|uniref:Acetyltransferase (GNAT) domain-containing protein n=1 Tax=Alkalibacterium subtropicum TaxID=753702 RepID=A0A1I1GUS6_9LACT|nr:GNAT family N-acetyltransferase [Alkalibacterium subtropicum]SFC15281.1 Acetyltransferase (GNAT) domain-containing protein [Alkalibacterium subtropicum]
MVTFKSIATHSALIDENEFFAQYYDPAALFRYDSNFFQLKYSPTREEFELIESMHLVFSLENGLSHVKFYWPENQGILPDTLDYLNEAEYGLEKLELYSLDPAQYTGKEKNPDISVEVVQADQLASFKRLNYIEDKTVSESFAESKQTYYDRLYRDASVTFLLACFQGDPAGSCITIESDAGLELDDLFTLETYRFKGVATALQAFVIEEALAKQTLVFLAADAEDSPKEMYKKAGFNYEGFRIGAQKVIKGEG